MSVSAHQELEHLPSSNYSPPQVGHGPVAAACIVPDHLSHAPIVQVKLKNPSLLLQLQSVPPRMPGLTASILGASGMTSHSSQKTLLTTLTRSPSSNNGVVQQSVRMNRSPSQKGAWAY